MPPSLSAIQALIVDMDGVLWRGAQPLPGVADFFNFLSEHGIRFLLATNNAARPTAEIRGRIEAMGAGVEPGQFLTAAQATARWVLHRLPGGASLLLVGEEGLFEAMADTPFRVINPLDPLLTSERASAVIVGLDRGLTYEKLRRATAEIRGGAEFIATNTDATLPTENGLIPGAGSIVAAVQTATSKAPTIIGKPYRPLFDAALEVLGSAPQATAMLGDRLDTDIQGGANAGLATILVLTGVTSGEEAAASPIKADFTFDNLIALRKAWYEELETQTR